jgi:hypothetical protein
MLDEAEPVLFVEIRDDRGVRPRRKDVPRALEPGPRLGRVVDLAVADGDDAAVLVRERLVASFEIDDREAPAAEPDPGRGVDALSVRPAVDESPQHARDDVACDRLLGISRRVSGDAAHQAHRTSTPSSRRTGSAHTRTSGDRERCGARSNGAATARRAMRDRLNRSARSRFD